MFVCPACSFLVLFSCSVCVLFVFWVLQFLSCLLFGSVLFLFRLVLLVCFVCCFVVWFVQFMFRSVFLFVRVCVV